MEEQLHIDIKQLISCNEQEYYAQAKKYISEYEKKEELTNFLTLLFNELIKNNQWDRAKLVIVKIDQQIKDVELFAKKLDRNILFSEDSNNEVLSLIQSYLSKDKSDFVKTLKEDIQNFKNKMLKKKNKKKQTKDQTKVSNNTQNKKTEKHDINSELQNWYQIFSNYINKNKLELHELNNKLKELKKQKDNLYLETEALNEKLSISKSNQTVLEKDILKIKNIIADQKICIENLKKECCELKNFNQTLQNEQDRKKIAYRNTIKQKLKMRYEDFKKYGETASSDELFVMLKNIFEELNMVEIDFE